VTGYEITRDGAPLATVGVQTSYSDTTAAPSTSYSYQVRARDAAGNLSAFSNTASATTPASNPPTTLTFNADADARVAQASPTANFGTSTSLSVDNNPVEHSYLRFIVSGVGGTVQSAKLRLYVTDSTSNGPAVFATSNNWSETGITWNNKPAAIGSGVADKGALSASAWVEFDITVLVPGNGTYSFVLPPQSTNGLTLSSKEATTNRPQLVLTVSGGTGDTEPPTAPGTLTATAVGPTQVNLSWTASTDNVGVTGYEISRDGAPLATVGVQTSYSDTTAAPGTSYSYQVRARDAAGNLSAPSNSAAVTTPGDGTTLTFAAEADAYVEEANPNANFGTGGLLLTDTLPNRQCYLRFTVAGVTGSVQSAKLRVFATDGTSNGPQIFATGTGWSETGITWSNRPAPGGVASDDKGAISTSTWVEFNVLPIVTGNGTFSFVLISQSTNGLDLSAREGTQPPQLVLTVGQ
jgi:chitodextrinase